MSDRIFVYAWVAMMGFIGIRLLFLPRSMRDRVAANIRASRGLFASIYGISRAKQYAESPWHLVMRKITGVLGLIA
jgi:hypothetical protein